MLRQLCKYSITGGFAAMINFGSRILYEGSFSFSTSLVLAYLTGMSFNFILSRRYVFCGRGSSNISKQYFTFFLVASIGLLVTYLATITLLSILLNAVHLDEELAKSSAHIFGIGCGFLANFFGHKSITFKLSVSSGQLEK